MLLADMVERANKRIPIIDAKIEDVRQLVTFIYTAKVSPEYTRFKELSALGDRYNVQSLVAFCAIKLEASLTVENALDMDIFAPTYNSNLLMMDKCAGVRWRLACVTCSECLKKLPLPCSMFHFRFKTQAQERRHHITCRGPHLPSWQHRQFSDCHGAGEVSGR